MIIKTHKDLSKAIQGKSVLHLNSLGKDSVVALEWLAKSARLSRIISVHFGFLAKHPDDDRYIEYLKKRYPSVLFITEPNAVEINLICAGAYQPPTYINNVYNWFELEEFSRDLQVESLREKFGCDYICDGSSKYESFARRTKFNRLGILIKNRIYPLGMMRKEQVISVIRNAGIKLHPCYKVARSTFDHPSYWKMRNLYLTNEAFRERIDRTYPLFCLDRYRYERLLK